MLEKQKIKKIITTIIKGLPIIFATTFCGLMIAKFTIRYSSPQFQSVAKIKLDDQKHGFSANNLYEDLDVFSSENKIETEAEILKSPLLIGKTVDKMKLGVEIYRIGDIKKTLLYKDNPFTFEYSEEEKSILKMADHN